MVSPNIASQVSELYEVAKVIDVVVRLGAQNERIRIEALHDLHQQGTYSTRAYIDETFVMQPKYPSGLGQDRTIWVLYDLPWTSEQSADDAINRALAFLLEHGEAAKRSGS